MSELPLMEQVRSAWAEVLDVDSADAVPLDTNFLEAGGNSLLLVLLWEHLTALTDRVVKVSDLFQHGTVRAQTALLTGQVVGPTELGAKDRRRLLDRAKRTGPVASGAE